MIWVCQFVVDKNIGLYLQLAFKNNATINVLFFYKNQ